eukprot:1557460-Rhodomonas_salina.5
MLSPETRHNEFNSDMIRSRLMRSSPAGGTRSQLCRTHAGATRLLSSRPSCKAKPRFSCATSRSLFGTQTRPCLKPKEDLALETPVGEMGAERAELVRVPGSGRCMDETPMADGDGVGCEIS